MGKGSRSSRAVVLVLSQALWVLPGVQPASAQTFPPNFISPNVPHDVPAGSAATVAQLAVFAWQEFIALNWVAMNPGTTSVRGRPNTTVGPPGFLGIAPDANGNFPLVVWQTYRHKNELFPADGNTASMFDSTAPTYKYATAPTAAVGGPIPSFNLFNNLDETSQIGLDFMYAHATSAVLPPSAGPGSGPPTGVRVAYEAKVNRALFNYAINPSNPAQALTNSNNSYQNLTTKINTTKAKLATDGGSCSATTDPIVQLPCGTNTTAGDPGEGAIEIKAAWRKLTPGELSGGRYFTRNVIFYSGPPGNQHYNNAVWGLVALHIIHKTTSFPNFVFATWEQVDDYDGPPTDPDYLAFQNLVISNNGVLLSPLLPNIPVTRANPIHSQVAATNAAVRAAFMAQNASTVWQYYQLVGVQATPMNAPPANAPADALSYFYLANIMVETNQTLQNFVGGAPTGVIAVPHLTNVYLKGASGSPFIMGGCQGCHGFQGQDAGGDMSVLIARGARAPGALPDSIDSSPPPFPPSAKKFRKTKPPGKGAP